MSDFVANVTPLKSDRQFLINRRKTLFGLVGVAVILGLVSVAMFIWGGSSFTESGVALTIDGPTQASVGDEVVYKVKYENNTKTALKNLKLTFTYPEAAVILKDGNVVTDPGNIRSVDQEDLNPGESREQEFNAFLVGERGNVKVARVKLAFIAGSIKTPFEKTAQISTTISDVPVAVTLVGPPTTVSGQAVSYLIDYRNQSDDDISDLQLTAQYPDGFAVTKVSPAASIGNNTWNIATLKKGAGSRITIQGVLTGREGEAKAVKVTLKRDVNGTYVDYVKSAVTTVISSPLLSLNVSINDGGSDYISHAGDTLQYQIQFRNTSTFILTGLTMTAKLDGSMYDLSTLDTRGGFYDSATRTVTWNSTVVPDFNSLRPGVTGSVKFVVKLKPTLSGAGSNSLFARAIIELGTDNVPDTVETDRVSVKSDVVTKVTSQPNFTQSMYYNDAAFGSSGPMPPQAGQDTVFTVHWQLINPGNAINAAKIVGTLPQGVTWKNVIGVGAGQPQPTYNKNTSQVTWNIGMLPAGAGTGGSAAYELSFQVTVKPSPTQVGQPVVTITNTAFSGTDSFTGQKIVTNAPDLDTNTTVDRAGQGAVQ